MSTCRFKNFSDESESVSFTIHIPCFLLVKVLLFPFSKDNGSSYQNNRKTFVLHFLRFNGKGRYDKQQWHQPSYYI
jgi:hypothetical protein